jgi:ribosome biogenesis protein Tsr3
VRCSWERYSEMERQVALNNEMFAAVRCSWKRYSEMFVGEV